MGIFDFIKNAGDREGVAKENESEEKLRELTTANTIIRKIRNTTMSVDGVRAKFDDGVATLEGDVPDQETREKVVLMAGNTPGVAKVDDRLTVAKGGAGTRAGFYTVVKGDSLSKIAKAELGDANRWKEIFEANKPMLSDPDRIYPGQALRIPR